MRGTVYIAEIRGFCSGVERAVRLVERAVENGPFPVRVLHEIVHNESVVEEFRKKGVLFAEELDPAWEGGTLIFSAHGVSEKVERQAREMNVNLIDATCPLVKGIHRKAAELEREGYRILLIGKRSHREIEGVVGRVRRTPLVIESKTDAENVAFEKNAKYACLTQTTLSVDDCAELFRILKERFPEIRICGGICNATTARQTAVKKLAARCGRIIVIGSGKSSNSRKLREVAESCGAESILISSIADLPDSWLKDGDIGITSGASAPEHLLREAVEKLVSLGWATES